MRVTLSDGLLDTLTDLSCHRFLGSLATSRLTHSPKAIVSFNIYILSLPESQFPCGMVPDGLLSIGEADVDMILEDEVDE